MRSGTVYTKQERPIATMFNRIAKHYDCTNCLMSFGIDRIWRKKLIASLKRFAEKTDFEVIDVACGTGDISLALVKQLQAKVIGIDISEGMLEQARSKTQKWMLAAGIEGAVPYDKQSANGLNEQRSIQSAHSPLAQYILASANAIPFEANRFDAATLSFGIRNFENRPLALGEIFRVLKPGAPLKVLEFAIPTTWIWKALYKVYLNVIIPLFGLLQYKNRYAYKYLSKSINAFPRYEALCQEFEKEGFTNCNYKKLSGGIAVLYTAFKP